MIPSPTTTTNAVTGPTTNGVCSFLGSTQAVVARRSSSSVAVVDDNEKYCYDNERDFDADYNDDGGSSWRRLLVPMEVGAVVDGDGDSEGKGRDTSSKNARCSGNNVLSVISIATCTIFACYALGTTLGAMISSFVASSKTVVAPPDNVMSASSSLLLVDTKGMPDIEGYLMTSLAESSYIRGKVIDTMIDDLTVSNGYLASRSDRFNNAMEALHLLEFDGEPIMVEDHPFLFVGSIGER
jgi:hypothetical protein